MSIKTLQRAFAGGVVTPEFFGQVQDAKYQTGLAICRNFIVKPHGPVANRPGSVFVTAVKNNSLKTKLLSYIYSTTQTMVLEVGNGYMRFITQGAVLQAGSPAAYNGATTYVVGALVSQTGTNYYCIKNTTGNAPPNATYWYALPTSAYEIPTPYQTADLFDLHTVQSNDVLTIVHPNYPPMVLERFGATNWVLAPIEFASSLFPPLNPVATATVAGTGTAVPMFYVVTSVDATGLEESLASNPATCSNNIFGTGAVNTITWPVAAGAVRYNIYRKSNGLYGFIGQTDGLSYQDTNQDDIAPDLGKTPPLVSTPFTPGQITAVNVTAGGTGYTSTPTLTITSTAGGGFIGSVDIAGGIITNIKVISPGKNYAPGDTIAITGGGGASATATLTIGPSTNIYPGATTYFQQRKDFAGTLNLPQTMWMTRVGTESNLSYSIPTHDDDSITFKIAAREANTIRHLVPLTSLLALTSAAEYRITSINSDAITPTSVSVTPQSYIGASNVQPLIVNNNVLFAAERGGHMREMAYVFQANGFVTGDLSLRAPHLFDGYKIADMAYAKCPYPIAWEVSSSGLLLGLTYVPEQQIGAWHTHDSYTANGTVMSTYESVCVVPEGNEDGVYVIVNRVVNGSTVRYIERFASQLNTQLATAFYVDAGVQYSGAPITTVTSGIGHLEGETVSILADGQVLPRQVVTGGVLTFPQAYSQLSIGLPITADIETLPLATMIEAFGQGMRKNLNQIYVRVNNSSGLYAGPSFDNLVPAKQRTTEPAGTPPRLITDEINIVIKGSWNNSGQCCIRQSDPLPMCIVSMTLEAELGG